MHHDERPVDEFDNTDLSVAVERGLVNPVPDTPAELAPETPKKRRGLIIGASAAVAGAAIVAGSILGIKAASDANAEGAAPEPDPDQTTQVEPAPEEPEAETPTLAEQIAEKEIPAGLSPEEYADRLFELRTEWVNAGASDDLVDASIEANLTWEEFLPQVVDEKAEIYAPALFGANWKDSAELVEYVGEVKKLHLDVLLSYVRTAWNRDTNPENIEAYRYWSEPADTHLVKDEGAARHFQISVMNYSNADRNSAPDGITGQNNGKIKMLFNTRIENGVEHIASIGEYVVH